MTVTTIKSKMRREAIKKRRITTRRGEVEMWMKWPFTFSIAL